MTMDDDEILLTKPEVFVYSIPLRIQKKRGYIHRASDWDVSTPVWHGKLKLIAAGQSAVVQLEDKRERLFGRGTLDKYPSPTLENVVDSSRYFVLEIENKAGDTELVGIGFSSRSDSSDFTNALKDHFSDQIKAEIKIEDESAPEAKKPKIEENATSENEEQEPKPQRKKQVVQIKTEVKTVVVKKEGAVKTTSPTKPVSPVKKAVVSKTVAKSSPGNKATAKVEIKEESNDDSQVVSPVKKVLKPVATVSPQKDAQVNKKESDESTTTAAVSTSSISTPPKTALRSILKKSNTSSPLLSVNPAPAVSTPPPEGTAKLKVSADFQNLIPYKFPEPEPLVPFIETLRGKIPSLPLTDTSTTTTPGKCNIKVTTTPKATPTKVIKKVTTTTTTKTGTGPKGPTKTTTTTTTTTVANKSATPAPGLLANPLYKPKPASVAAAAAAKSPTKSVIKTTKTTTTKAAPVVQSNKKPLVNLAKAAQKAQVVPATESVDDEELVSKSDNDNNQNKKGEDNEVELVDLDDEEDNSTNTVEESSNKEENDNDVEMVQEDASPVKSEVENVIQKNEKVDEKSIEAEELKDEEKPEATKEETEMELDQEEEEDEEEESPENDEETGDQEMTEEKDEEEAEVENEEEEEEEEEQEQEEDNEEEAELKNENETESGDEDIPEADPIAMNEYLEDQSPLGEIKDIEQELEQLEEPKTEPKVETDEADLEPQEEEEDDESETTITGILPNYKYYNKKTKQFQCHRCDSGQFSDMREIKTHWHHEHGYKHPAHCVVCKLPFPSKQEMVAHRKSVHGFQCTLCGKEFKKEKAVADHMRQVHPGEQPQAASPSKCLFECDTPGCEDKKFGSEQELKGHKLTHLNHLKCDRCSESFPTRGTLRSHHRNCHPGQ